MASNQLSAAELAELVQYYKQIENLSQSAATNAANLAQQQGNARTQLERLRREYQDWTSDIDSSLQSFKEISSELNKFKTGINDSKKSYSNLESLAQKLQYHQKGINSLSSRELENLQKKAKQQAKNLETSQNTLTNDRTRLLEEQRRYENIINRKEILGQSTDKEYKKLIEIESILSQISKSYALNQELLDNDNQSLEHTLATISETLKKQKAIEKSMGLTGALMKSISKIPFLGDLPGMREVLGDVEEEISAIQKNTGKTVSRTKAMGMAFKKMGPVIKDAFTDPLVTIGLLVKGFKMFLELGFAVDKQVTEMSKSMAVSKDVAALTRDRFVEIQSSSNNLLETTNNLVDAQGQLAKSFGTTLGFTDAQLKDQIMLTKQVGLEEEAAAGLQQLALANGKSANDILKSTVKQTAALARQTGVQLDNRKVLAEVAKVSGQLRLQYQNNPELIAKAVVQTQKLGISFETAKNMANKLLDFENSISSELEAELLTGKQLNLEEARLLALQGKSAEAAALIAEQVGSAAEFSELNVIAQQSLAEAAGMSADELANSLVYQENLAKLGSQAKQQVEEQVQKLKDLGKTEEANQLMKSIGNAEAAEKALQEISAQEKFNAAIDKLKSMLSSIVEGPAAKFVNILGAIVSDADSLKTIFYGISTIIGALSLTRLITGLATALVTSGALAATTAGTASAITLGLGAIAIVAGIASIMGAVNAAKAKAEEVPAVKIKDGIINPRGGLVVSGPEGSIQLDKKDSVIAGTNLGGGGSEKNTAIEEQNALLREIVNRPVKVDVGNFFNDSARSAVRIQ
jgi:myosin heavy subunit